MVKNIFITTYDNSLWSQDLLHAVGEAAAVVVAVALEIEVVVAEGADLEEAEEAEEVPLEVVVDQEVAVEEAGVAVLKP